MTFTSPPTARPPFGPFRVPGWAWVMAGATAAYAGLSAYMLGQLEAGEVVIFQPSLAPVAAAPLVVQTHVAGALSAFAIGSVLLLLRKGNTLHRTLGWSWVLAMAVTAISSFFMRGLMGDSFSPIHALSAWTMIGLPMGVVAARRKNIAAHRKHMTGMFLGGMVIAGLFTFLPGRLMWHTLFQIG